MSTRFLCSLFFLLSLYTRAAGLPDDNVVVTVTSADGQILPGASVTLLNTPFAGATRQDGIAMFRNVRPGQYTLTVSMMGYSTITKTFQVNQENITEVKLQLSEAARSLDEVVVSTDRSENTALRVPVSVTALNSKQIENARIWRFDDITAISPNFHVSPSGGGFYMMTVRGINSFSKIPAVISYIDDVPMFNGYVMGYNMQDLERIEFLRGPQGTLFGRGASGGVLTITSKKPTNHFGGFAEVSLGNYNQQRYNAGIRAPLVKDKLFLSASGLYNYANGFFTNTFDGKRAGDETNIGGNFKLSFLPNDKWMINYDLRGETNHQDGSATLAATPEAAFENGYNVNVDKIGGLKRRFLVQSLSASYFAKNFTVKSITALQNIRIETIDWDLDYTSADYQSYYNPRPTPSNYFSQEFKISSNRQEDRRFNWVGGLFYLNTWDKDMTAYKYGVDSPPMDLGNGNFLNPPYETVTTSSSTSNSYAIYGQASYRFLPKTEIQAGLRFEHETASLNTGTDLLVPGAPAMVMTPAAKAQTSFSALSPKASLIHYINNQSSVYVSYTRGYRPGGVNPYTADVEYLEYTPEFSNNVEIGYKMKTENNRLRWNLAAFHIRLNDQQIYTLTSGFNFATLNIGNIQTQGVESELSFIPLRGFQVDWNVGYTDARYRTLPYFIFDAQGMPEDVDLEGNKPIQAPEITSFVALSWGRRLTDHLKLQLRGEWKYTGDQYFDYVNSIKQEAFSVFNVRAGLTYKNFELNYWARNIADKRYLPYAYPFSLTASQLSNPRTWGFTLTTRF